jgi:hypothetical protein
MAERHYESTQKIRKEILKRDFFMGTVILVLAIAFLLALIVNLKSFLKDRRYYKKAFNTLDENEILLEKNRQLLAKIDNNLLI